MNEFGPLDRRGTLAQQIAQVLRTRISEGALRPGDRLPTEQQLAASFQVSRTVIREAVSSLKHDGLIDTRQGAGAFVSEASRTTLAVDTSHLDHEQTLLYTYEVRFTLEPAVAALAAERRVDADLAPMRAALAKMREAARRGSGDAETDAEFHRSVVLAARNPYFIGLSQLLQSTMVEAMRVSIANTAQVTRGPENTWREHERIFRAIEQGDAAAAEKAARAHLKNSATRLSISRNFDARGRVRAGR